MLSFVKEIMNMKKLNVALAILVTAVMAGNAQTSVNSDIVGYQSVTVPVGRSIYSAPFILEEVAKGSVSANTATQVESSVGAITLATANQYYMEILTGAYEGDRIDVDVTATNAAQSANPGRIILKSVSYNSNTLTGSEIVGQTIAIRKHLTLSALTSLISSGSFVANAAAANADQVLIYGATGFETYYYVSSANGWYKQSPFAPAQTKVIPPGSAIMFVKKTAAVTLTGLGTVRTTKLQLPMAAGFQLVSTGYPVDSALSALNPNGTWTANATAANADQVLIYGATGFETYYYVSSANGWYKQSPFAKSTGNILSSSGGFLVKKKSSDVNYAVASQVTN